MASVNYPLFASLTGVNYSGDLTPGDIAILPTGDKGADIVRYALTRLGALIPKPSRARAGMSIEATLSVGLTSRPGLRPTRLVQQQSRLVTASTTIF